MEVQGLSSIPLLLLQQQVTSHKPSREASKGILPEYRTSHKQSRITRVTFLWVLSSDTGTPCRTTVVSPTSECSIVHPQGCFKLCSGLAFMPLGPENNCYPRAAQQPPMTYVRSMKEDDVNPSSSSGLLTLHAMEGVNCFG